MMKQTLHHYMTCSRFAGLLLLLLLVSCKDKDPDPIPLEGCQQCTFNYRDIPFDSLFNSDGKMTVVDNSPFIRDRDSIFLYGISGVNVYHPVSMAHTCFTLLARFNATGDSANVRQLEKYAQRFQQIAYPYDSAVYFPYLFDYKVHQRTAWQLHAPWFSGMAQGEILSVFMRTFDVTQDSSYLIYAHKIFNSFLRVRGEAEPWVVRYDQDGCYWIEEYPLDKPGMTLNGFMYAIFGLYDYYRVVKTEEAKAVLDKALSTIKSYIHLYRRPGQDSFYCLEHQHLHGNKTYHMIHIAQLRGLYDITGDSYFKEMADSLFADSH